MLYWLSNYGTPCDERISIFNPYYTVRDISIQDSYLFLAGANTYQGGINAYYEMIVVGGYTTIGIINKYQTVITNNTDITLNRLSVWSRGVNDTYLCATFLNSAQIWVSLVNGTSHNITSPIIMDTTFYNGGDYIVGTVVGGDMNVLDISISNVTSNSFQVTPSFRIIVILFRYFAYHQNILNFSNCCTNSYCNCVHL